MRLGNLSLCALALLPAVLGCNVSPVSGDEECATQGDAVPSNDTTVIWRIVNTTGAPIYLEPEADCTNAALKFEITGPDGAVLDTEEFFCGGDATCQAIQEPDYAGQCEPCPTGPVRMIPAGATFDTPWNGTHYVHTTIPATCLDSEADGEPDIECVDRVAAAAGAHTVKIRAFTACSFQGQPCECGTTDADGTCVVQQIDSYSAASSLSGELSREVEFEMPFGGPLVVAFGGS